MGAYTITSFDATCLHVNVLHIILGHAGDSESPFQDSTFSIDIETIPTSTITTIPVTRATDKVK